MQLNLKTKRKQTLLGILKTIAYFAGYPLMVLFVAYGSVPFMKEGAFSGTWYLGIVIALIPWLVCAVLQIAFGCFTHNQALKTIVVSVVATVCMLGCGLAVDLYGKQVIEDVNKRYAADVKEEDGETVVTAKTITVPVYRMGENGVDTVTWTMSSTSTTFPTIDYLKGHYVTLTPGFGSATDSYLDELETFMRVYNVSLYGSNKKVTDDGKYVTNTDMTTAVIDPETGIPFCDNGVVSESYVYSVDFAINVLINYYEAVNKFKTLNIDMTPYVEKVEVEPAMGADETKAQYEARVAAMTHEQKLETDAQYRSRIANMTPAEKLETVYKYELQRVMDSDEYKEYQTSDEYVAAYGEDGSAYKFMLSKEKVMALVPVLLRYVTFILQYNEFTGGITYTTLDGALGLSDLVAITNKEDGYTMADIRAWLISSLGGLLGSSINGIADMLTDENLENLLREYDYYYSPSVRTAFDFFGEATDGAGNLIGEFKVVTGLGEDSTELTFSALEMRAFAYARYYAKTNGAVIGSVLVPNNDEGLGKLLNADGNIGQITMSASGYPASYAYTLDQIYQLKADKEYVPSLFPTLVARRYLYIFVGWVVLSVVLFYQFGRREEECLASLAADQMTGGAK